MTKVLVGLTGKKDFVTERLKLKDLYPERAEALAKEHKIDVEDLELVRKGIVAEKAEVDKDSRAVTSYINTALKDRDNEIIEPEGAILTHYRKNPVVPYGHDYRGLPVAKNIWIKKDKKGLLAKTVFLKHSLADDVYRLYSEDVAGTGPAMKGWSIGFIPLKWEESPEGKGKPPKEGEQDTRPKRTYKKWELLEYSAVMIPSNREALTEMVEKGLIKSDRLKEEIAECVGDECAITVTKPEETDDFIRIPVRDCKVTATITILEKQGITALYCGKIKKIRTYIFNKKPPYNWTMKKALAWVKEHGKGIDEAINKWSETDGLELNKDTEQLLEEQLEKMLKAMDKTGNWDSTDNGEVIGLEETTTDNPDTETHSVDTGTMEEEQTEREQQITMELFDRLTAQLNKVEEELKSLKEGRVLSSKNRKLIQDCLASMEAAIPPLKSLLTATEPPQREEFELEVNDGAKSRPVIDDGGIEIETSKGLPDPDPELVQYFEKKDERVEKIASIIKNRIGEMVQSAINKARGKVE